MKLALRIGGLLMLSGLSASAMAATATFTPVTTTQVNRGDVIEFDVVVSAAPSGFNSADVIIGADTVADISFAYDIAWMTAFANVSPITYDVGFYAQDVFVGGNNASSVGTSLALGRISIDTTAIAGGFHTVRVDNVLDGVSTLGLGGVPNPLSGSVQFEVLCTCDPDLNGSGGVDAVDLTLFDACMGQPATCNPDADLFCDGFIDEKDLGIIVAAFLGIPVPDACTAPVGACCLDLDDSCVVQQQLLCDGTAQAPDLTGTYQGDATTCSPNPCAPPPPLVGDDVCSGGTNAGNPCSENGDCPGGGVCGSKSRYISFNVPAVASNVATGASYAIRIEILSMPQFPARVGEIWWGGPAVSLPNPPFGSVTGSQMQCTTTPHMQVWKGLGTIHCFGDAVAPESAYGVSLCTSASGPCGTPVSIQTGIWADVVVAFGGPSQPNFADISATVDSFKGLASAPPIVRTDLGPQLPDHVANFADISAAVDAFKGTVYPYTPPACP